MTNAPAHSLHGGDPADSIRASYREEFHDEAEDIWADEWLEMCRKDDVRVCPQAVKLGKAAFVKTTLECDLSMFQYAQRRAVMQLLKQITTLRDWEDKQVIYHANCWLSALNETEKSMTEIGADYGKTRAAASKKVQNYQIRMNPMIKARSQKSLESRKTNALAALLTAARQDKGKELTPTQQRKQTKWTAKSNN
jgi:hypothetical protein